MKRTSRRRFLTSSAAVAAGFSGLRWLVHSRPAWAQHPTLASADQDGYGELLSDPAGILDLPRGFQYQIVSRRADEMDDGMLVPGEPDGMAALPGPDGLTLLIRNHELTPDNTGPYGRNRARMARLPITRIYDAGEGKTPGSGGTTTLVYDTRQQRKVREFLSLAGTIRNCAGGPTPWGSWVSCEETVDRAGQHGQRNAVYVTEKDHGYNFEVAATAHIQLAEPVPLIAMGRFRHEAVAVDSTSGFVYQTEDQDDGLLYRFIPNEPGKLREGGRLQALALVDRPSTDTRNWNRSRTIAVGEPLAVQWVDLDQVTAPDDDLRRRGFDQGAARFARGEGIWFGTDELYFACTSGGVNKLGQIWRYRPRYDDQAGSAISGQLTLFIEPNDSNLIVNADNLTVAPWGDLIVCEDRSGPVVRLVGVTPRGQCYAFALHHLGSEFAGVTFSPDGTTMFVNIMGPGLTLAITGPWRHPPV